MAGNGKKKGLIESVAGGKETLVANVAGAAAEMHKVIEEGHVDMRGIHFASCFDERGMRMKLKANRPTGGKWGIGPQPVGELHKWVVKDEDLLAWRIRRVGGVGGGGSSGKEGGGGGNFGARATRSMRWNTAQKIAESRAFTLESFMEVVEKKEPAIFDSGDVTIEMINAMRRELREYKHLHRTTTNNTATMTQIFDNPNGLDRIEEGVHDDEWTCGSADEIVDLLFDKDSAFKRAWELLKSIQIFEEQKTSSVMVSGDARKIMSGDARKIIQRSENHGGVDTGRELQITPCHFDDVHNFSLCLWGIKTFLLAKPGDVAYGPAPEINLNHAVDTTSDRFTKYVLHAGEVIYLPPKWWHEVQTVASGSMTLGLWLEDAAAFKGGGASALEGGRGKRRKR